MNKCPAKINIKSRSDYHIAYPKICLTIFAEIIYSPLLYGGLFKRSSFGGPVAKASEARESMIIFTQRSWIAARGDSHIITEPRKDIARATRFTVS